MSFSILIPTINRKDLLMDALFYYNTAFPNTNIVVLDNGYQDIMDMDVAEKLLNLHVWSPPTQKNLGVASSWNYLIKKAIDYYNTDYFLVLNDDIILKKDESVINSLIQTWGNNTFHIPRPFYNWSAFLFNRWIYERVGEFDENFKKCFFEDNDYHYRLKLAGVTIRYSDELNAEVYKNSQTIEKDPLLGGYIENREYFISKWGGLPDNETYKTPFNK